jgi:hypothetical protein
MNWPPPKETYIKTLFQLAIANKHRKPYMHRRSRGPRPLCDQEVDLEHQTLQDHEVTCPDCLSKLLEFSK